MISKASLFYVRMSPRKIRYVTDLVRRKNVTEAYSILDRTTKRASPLVKKLIQSAADAAIKNSKESVENLMVSCIYADGAGMLKRFRSMSMGRAGEIRKRMSHVYVELDRAIRKSEPTRSVGQPHATKAIKPVKKIKQLSGAKA